LVHKNCAAKKNLVDISSLHRKITHDKMCLPCTHTLHIDDYGYFTVLSIKPNMCTSTEAQQFETSFSKIKSRKGLAYA